MGLKVLLFDVSSCPAVKIRHDNRKTGLKWFPQGFFTVDVIERLQTWNVANLVAGMGQATEFWVISGT